MKYALSNLAFNPHEKKIVYAMMRDAGFTGLEIAPSLFLNGSENPYNESMDKLFFAKEEAESFGLEIVSIQSFLFGAKDLTLFSDKAIRKNLLDYCKKVVDFASILNVKNLVFGSPKNRVIPDGMNKVTAQEIAVSFFKELGDYAEQNNTCISMEANASVYGCNFIMQTKDAISLIEAVGSSGFRLNLDTGTILLESEDVNVIEEALPYANHIHISEGYLVPVYSGNLKTHKMMADIIKNGNYSKYVSIEMKAGANEDNKDHIKKAIEFVNQNYR